MPSMQKIYNNHSLQYDELVNHEDYKNNLRSYLLEKFDFKGKKVIEFGVGTGRVTKMFAELAHNIFCYDKSLHMLEKAIINLKPYTQKIEYSQCDNNNIEKINMKADIVIEGWSFGHAINENPEKIATLTNKLYSDCARLLNKDGIMIVIETLGTNVKNASAPSKSLEKFYQLLVNSYGFNKKIIRTDYLFESMEEAKRIMSFFFGTNLGNKLNISSEGIVKEFTGIWSKQL